MGYFRLFYYITYILNFLLRLIKRHGKFILLFISIAVFLIVCNMPLKSQAAYLGDDSYFDPYYAIQQKYDSICMDLIRRVEYYKTRSDFNQNNLDNLKSRFASNDYYLYYQTSTTDDGGLTSLSGGIFNDNFIRIIFFTPDNANLNISPSAYDTYYNINDNIREVKFTSSIGSRRFVISNQAGTFTFASSDTNVTYYIPHSLFHYQSKYIYEYFVNNTSFEQIELMYEMDSKLASIDDTLQNQQEFLTEEPDANDFSTNDIPTNSGVTDTTEDGLNTFFSTFYTAFTNTPAPGTNRYNIVVSIPFTR